MENKRLLVALKVCFIIFCLNGSAAILIAYVQAFPDLLTIHLMPVIRTGDINMAVPVIPLVLVVLSIALYLFVVTRIFKRIIGEKNWRRRKRESN